MFLLLIELKKQIKLMAVLLLQQLDEVDVQTVQFLFPVQLTILMTHAITP